MASKTTRTTTSLNQDQLRNLEKSLTDAYNLAGLNDIRYDKDKQQRKDVIGNIYNPSCSGDNKTKIENFKRHLAWKLKDAKVEGITNLESFFGAIKKSSANLSSYPNLANLKENLSTKVTVESPPRSMSPTRNVPKALPRSTVHIASERGPISFSGSGSPLKSNIPPPPPNYLAPSYKAQAEEKARREAEEKARREAKAKAQAPNQAKDNPSLWLSFATSLNSLQQNVQNTNQQAKLPKKKDDKKENFLPNWVALVSGLLNQQGEKNESKLPPQKDPPPIDTKREKPIGGQKIVPATNAPSNPIPPGPKTRAPEYYSHSRDICRLQSKFDENHNISYNQIKKDKDYFDQRVAKWDAELKVLNIATREPRKQDEPREMGFEGYVKYLDENIKKLKLKEADTSVNQDQLKTLIAFHYLEMAKAFYSSGQLHMDGIEGERFKKESVFDMVPEKYKKHLTESDTSINSYRLPRLEKENNILEVKNIEKLIKKYFPKEHLGRMPQSVLRGGGDTKSKPSTSVFKRISDKIVVGREMIEDDFMEDYNLYGGSKIALAYKSAKEGVTQIGDFVGRAAGAVADSIVRTGVRASPSSMAYTKGDARRAYLRPPSGLGYGDPSIYVKEQNQGAGEDLAILRQLYGNENGTTKFTDGARVPGGGGRRGGGR